MKKSILLTLVCALTLSLAHAQTWTGGVNTDWNTAGNWSPSGIPALGANITIPGTGITNWPKFASAVTVNNIDIQSGSRIDLNGFLLTVNGQFSANNVIFNNSNSSADIAITINGNNNGYLSSSTFNDALVFTYNSTSVFYEGYQGSNHYTSNLTIVQSASNVNLSYIWPLQVDGNLSVSRSAEGQTELFANGGNVGGNFSFTNLFGGNTYIGNNIVATINGTVSVNINPASGNPVFVLSKIKNLTTGGTLNVQKSGYVIFRSDTLKLSSLSATAFRNNTVNDFYQNDITASVTISDEATTNNTIYFRGNRIVGTTTVNLNGSGSFYEGYQGGNTITGNSIYNITGTGSLFHGYDLNPGSGISGDLIVTRTGAGQTELLRGGITVGGNFSYTNNAGGSTVIGRSEAAAHVTGNVTLTSDFGSNTHSYQVIRLINQGAGGTISLQHPNYVIFSNDTLKAASINISQIRNGTTTDIIKNDLTTNLTIGDDAVTGAYTYFRGNKITGSTTFNRTGPQPIYEAYQGANYFAGTTTYNLSGPADAHLSYDTRSYYQGNVFINRSVAGTSYIFAGTGADINGNFSYVSTAGGTANLGNVNDGGPSVLVSGTVNISANPGAESGVFSIGHFINQTTGGNFNISNMKQVSMTRDTLKVSAYTFTNIANNSTSDFIRNQLEGPFTFSDDATTGAYTYFRGNTMLSDVTWNRTGSQDMYEAYIYPNNYLGNVQYNVSSASRLYLAYSDSSVYHKNLSFNTNGPTELATRVKFAGTGNGTLSQSGTSPLVFQKLVMQKSPGAKLILNSPVSISDSIIFVSGNIEATTTNRVNFLLNSNHRGASATSHIIGPVSKTGYNAFTFPIGGASSIDSVSMSAPSLSTDVFSAQYFYGNPTAAGYDTAQRASSLKRISGCEYWDVKRENGTSNVTLKFGYDGLCTQGGYYVIDNTKARIAHWNGTSWEDIGNGGATGGMTGTISTGAAVSNFSPFTIGSTDILAAPLPLKLIYFRGIANNNNIQLVWQTENETNLQKFDLEKSADGLHFSAFTSVAAQNNSRNNYSSIDVSPSQGVNYYRLKQTDKNGSVTYSDVVKIDRAKKPTITVSPNPARGFIILEGAQLADVVRIVTVQGQTIATYKVSSTLPRFDINRLPAGVYVLQLVSDNNIKTMQFVKQ